MEQVKKVILIQLFNCFTTGILMVVLPLLMVDRRIDLASIGLIYASLPIISQLARVSFAIISDLIGRKIFFILTGILRTLSNLIYCFSFSPLEFLLGRITEGGAQASIWSVNRAFILEHSKRKWKALARLKSLTHIFIAFGTLAAGFLIGWFFYLNTLLICVGISLIAIPFAIAISERKKRRIGGFWRRIDLRRKSSIFKKTLLIFIIWGLSFGFITGYILPLFLKANGFSSEEIGIWLSLQTLLTGFFIDLSARGRIQRVMLFGGLFYSTLLVGLGFSQFLLAALGVILLGIPMGIVGGAFEGIVSKVAREDSYATDIGLLMLGLHGGRSISLALSGFLISLYGFPPIFFLSSLIFITFLLLSYPILRRNDKNS
jgi:MFS family permease